MLWVLIFWAPKIYVKIMGKYWQFYIDFCFVYLNLWWSHLLANDQFTLKSDQLTLKSDQLTLKSDHLTLKSIYKLQRQARHLDVASLAVILTECE